MLMRMSPRAPTGAALLQPHITRAITDAALDEWAERGYGRLAMEGVAKRAGVGKSALYRRWPSKQAMAAAVLGELGVSLAAAPDTGSLRSDLTEMVASLLAWLNHPQASRILPDLIAETTRDPALGRAVKAMLGDPRRERSRVVFERAIARGELPATTNIELVLDLVPSAIYWRQTVRGVPVTKDYVEELTEVILRAIGPS